MRAWLFAGVLLVPLSAGAQTAPVLTGRDRGAVAAGNPIELGVRDDVSGPMGLVPDAFRQAGDGTDDAPSIQRAIDLACSGTSHVLRFRARVYRVASAINQVCALHWVGQGWQEPNGGTGLATPGAGTWLQVVGNGFTPVTLTGNGAAGTVNEGIGIHQAHPAPAANWAPTPYPYVFNLSQTNGEVTFRHLMFLAVDKGITAFYGGRLKVTDVRGQFFTNAVHHDKSYDTSILEDIRNWPYWTQDGRVLLYQQANLDLLTLGRVDDTFADKLFSLPGRSVLRIVRTAADPASPATVPGGSVTNLHVGTIRGDFVKWTIWNSATGTGTDDVNMSVDTLIHQGQVWGVAKPIENSAAIRNDGSFAQWSISYLKADMLDRLLVDGTAATGPSLLQVGRAMVIFSRSTRASCILLDTGATGGQIQFGLPPLIDGGKCTVGKVPPGSTATVTWVTPN